MEQIILTMGVLLIIAAGLLFWRSQTRVSKEADQASDVMRCLEDLSQRVDARFDGITTQMASSSQVMQDSTRNVISEVDRKLGELGEATKQIHNVGKDISSLQDILQSPKLRGGIGEFFLGELLSQLPVKSYTLQYQFKSGDRVDAVIHLAQNMVPIDAKFPLENFRKMINCPEEERRALRRKFSSDVRKHIDDIAAKYILPDEGTFDFAMMYIPAENVYYETIIKDESSAEERNLLNYALSKHVFPVSPNSFFAYLQVIVFGLQGLRIEQNAREIISNLAQLRGDFSRFQEDFKTLGNHISRAYHKYDDAEKKVDRLGNKLHRVESPEAIESPESDQKLLM